jgi:hypothetical protein
MASFSATNKTGGMMEPYEADVFSASFYISEQYCVAHFGDLDEARAWLTTQQQAGVLRPHHVWQGNTVWLDEKDFRADAPQPDMAVCRRVESPALDAPPPQADDAIRQDIGLCAAGIVLAYHRKTHEHILRDDDTFKAALRVERWLGRR